MSDGSEPAETARAQASDAAALFAEACARLRDGPHQQPLDQLVNGLMTQLWDNCFTQTEIWTAFLAALDDMNFHAHGEERRA